VGFFGLVTEAGFTAAIVRRPRLDQSILSSAFWSAAGLGLIATTLAIVMARPIADLFGDANAAPFVAVSSVGLALGLAVSVPKGLLLRALRFRAISVIAIGNFSTYAATAIFAAAVLDLGAWSIILGKLAGSAVAALMTLAMAKWKPTFSFQIAAVRDDLAFNAGFLGNRLAGYTAKNLDYWAVGRSLGSALLGAYYIAYIAPNLIRQRMTWVAQRALLPVFSRMVDDPPRLTNAYLQVYRFTALIAVPALVGLAVVATGAIDLVFGPRWSAATGPLAILAVAAAIESLHPVNATLFLSQGRPSLNLLVNCIRLAALGIGLVAVRSRSDLDAYALAVLAATTVAVTASQIIALRRIPLQRTDFVRSVVPSVVPTLVMVVLIWAIGIIPWVESLTASQRLFIAVPSGIATYLAVGFGLFRETFRSLVTDLRSAVRGGPIESTDVGVSS
jgi:PST family polysaccharide transporter